MGKWASKHRRYSEADNETKESKMTRRRKRWSSSSQQHEAKYKPGGSLKRLQYRTNENSHEDTVTSIDIVSPTVIISASRDKTVTIQDLSSGSILHKWKAHSHAVSKVRKRKNLIATASRDLSIGLWNVDCPDICLGKLSEHTLVVSAIDLNSNGTNLFSGSRDNSVKIWDIETQQCLMENTISRNLVTDLKWMNDENLVVQTSEDKIVKLWDTRILEPVHTFPVQSQIQTCCDISGNLCLTGNNGFGGQGSQLNLWDIRSHQMVQELRGHSASVISCCFVSKSSDSFLSSSSDGSVRLWQKSKPTSISSLQLDSGNLSCISTLNASTVICGKADGTINIATIGQSGTLLNHA